MTATFVPPIPNCGHGGVTFTHYVIGGIWMCPLCIASIGGLVQTCSSCGLPPSPGTQLVDVFRHGRICFICRRDALSRRA